MRSMIIKAVCFISVYCTVPIKVYEMGIPMNTSGFEQNLVLYTQKLELAVFMEKPMKTWLQFLLKICQPSLTVCR